MVKVNRRKVLAGAVGAMAAMPVIGKANALNTPAVAPSLAFDSAAIAPAGVVSREELHELYHKLFLQVRDVQKRQEQLVQDALERDGRFKVTAKEALLLYDLAQINGDQILYPAKYYGWGPNEVPTAHLLQSLWKRRFVSFRKSKSWVQQRLVLRKNGREVAAFVQESCVERLGMMMSYMMKEFLPTTANSLQRLSGVWKDVVLYRL